MAVANLACILSIICLMWMAEARIPGVYSGGPWQSAHATFYGGSDASGTMGIFLVTHSLTCLYTFVSALLSSVQTKPFFPSPVLVC